MTKNESSLAAEIVSTGTEILLGDIVDTNAAWIAQQLRDIGVNLYYKTTVGDNARRLQGVLELALSRSNLIICTGGLGPTVDDITRDAIAEATGRPLVQDPDILNGLQARFTRWGTTMTENNARQSFLPEGSRIIPNHQGTAPGFITQDRKGPHQGLVIALPGVPREMKEMVTDSVIPFVQSLRQDTSVIRRRILRTIGIGESTLDNHLQDLMKKSNPTVGLAAKTGQVDIRIAVRAETVERANATLDELEKEIRRRVGDVIYATEENEPIEATVARLMTQNRIRVALLETNSGGAIASRLQRHLKDNADLLVVCTPETPGIVQAGTTLTDTGEKQAQHLVGTLSAHTNAPVSITVFCSNAPQHHSEDELDETWIAIQEPSGLRTSRYGLSGDDDVTVLRLGNRVLALLWRSLSSLCQHG